MRLGVFGGAFNPVHNGHLALASRFIDELGLDILFVLPTARPPHRSGRDFASEEDRLFMARAAFHRVAKAVVSDMEFKTPGKSYTYGTVQALKSMYPDAQLFLLVGSDQLLKFEEWYRYDDILRNATLCAAARDEKNADMLREFAARRFPAGSVIVAGFEPVDVSSSLIRDNLNKNKDISALVPKCVLDYIIEKGLYVERS